MTECKRIQTHSVNNYVISGKLSINNGGLDYPICFLSKQNLNTNEHVINKKIYYITENCSILRYQ